MHLLHRRPGPIRPYAAGIPPDENNYSEIREYIKELTHLIDEQQTQIHRGSRNFQQLRERQDRINHRLLRGILSSIVWSEEEWLQEFNDMRVAMELRGITLRRVKNQTPEEITDEYESEHWNSYLDCYTYLLYLMNRLSKDLADYEHGPRWWMEYAKPILGPPFPVGGKAASKARVDPEKAEGWDKKTKHVRFERRVQGWYFDDNDIPAITGRGEDEKARRKAQFADRVVDGKYTTNTMVTRRRSHGYVRYTEGFAQPKRPRVRDEYRLQRRTKPLPSS